MTSRAARGTTRSSVTRMDPHEVDDVDVAGFLARWWQAWLPEDDDYADQEMWEPFGRDFPGLAPAGGGPLTAAEREQVTGLQAAGPHQPGPGPPPGGHPGRSAGWTPPTGVDWADSATT
jgi:hypothetical protein